MLATSLDKRPLMSNYSDREYFIYHRHNNHGSLHIGHVIRSRSTGDMVIPVSLRINDAAGGFAGGIAGHGKSGVFPPFLWLFRASGS